MAINKSTVHIPFKRLDGSVNAVDAEPGTLEDAANVYQDPAGEWRSRRGMVRVGDEYYVPGSDDGFAYGAGTRVRDIGVVRDNYVLRTDIAVSSKSVAKSATVNEYWNTERMSPRVSLRSDVIAAGTLFEGNRDNGTRNYANAVDSVVVGGRLWVTLSTENGLYPGTVVLRCYDAASTTDQVTGALLYELHTTNAAILGPTDGLNCYCPKLAQYNDQSLVWTFVKYDAVNGDVIYVYRIADASATTQVSAPALRTTLDTGAFVYSDGEDDPVQVGGRAVYDIRRVGTDSPNDDVLVAYNRRTVAPSCYLAVYSVVAGASTTVTGNIVANCAVQWLAQPSNITGRMSLALVGDGYTVVAPYPTPISGLWRVVIDPSTRDVKGGITGALIQISTDVPEFLSCWTTVDAGVSLDNFAYSTPGAGYSYASGNPIVLRLYRQIYDSAAASYYTAFRNDGVIPVSRAFLTNHGAAEGGRWAFWAVYTGQNLSPLSTPAPSTDDIQQAYVLVSGSYCNTTTDVAFEVCGKVHHDQALVPYVGNKNGSLRMGMAGYGTYSSMHMTSPVVHRASTATRNGCFGTMLWRETGSSRGTPNQTVLCDVRADFGAEDMGNPVTVNGVVYFPGGIVDAFDWVDCAEGGFMFRPETPRLAASATGTSTAGVHYVRVVFSFRDSRGNVYRSAPSPVASVTTAPGTLGIAVEVQRPNMSARTSGLVDTAFGNFELEVYATTVGGTTYYKIPALTTTNPYFGTRGTNSVSLTVSPGTDTTLATGEVLYTQGGVLPNDCVPCGAVLASWNNRMWVAGCEDRATVRYSKEFEELEGVGWSDEFITRALGDDADFTALAPFGDRLFLFKRNKIFALAGDGPDKSGNGAYGPPELVADGVGTVRPASVVVTNDGVYFASMTSIMLLDGAGRVTDVGAPLRSLITTFGAHTTEGGMAIVGAAQIPASNLIAFHYAGAIGAVPYNGLFVWDMPNKTWYRWTWDGQTRVAGPVAATSAGLLVQTNTTGALELVLYDHNSTTYNGPFDTLSNGSNGITASLTTNWISLPTVGNYDRMYEAILQFRHYSSTPAITCQMTTDLDGGTSTETFTASPVYVTNDDQVQFRTKYPKGTRYKFWLYNAPNGTPTVPQVGYRGITMVVGQYPRTARLRVASKASS